MKYRNMKLIKHLKEKARYLKSEIIVLYFAYQNPDLSVLPRIVIFIALGYALSPIDLIPDFIPVLGYLDDLIIIPALIALSIKLIPEEIMNGARQRALDETITLRKNWIFAALFLLIWIILLTAVALGVLRLFNLE